MPKTLKYEVIVELEPNDLKVPRDLDYVIEKAVDKALLDTPLGDDAEDISVTVLER